MHGFSIFQQVRMLNSVGFFQIRIFVVFFRISDTWFFFGLSSSDGHWGRRDRGFKKKLTDIGLFCFSAIVGFETINYAVYQDCWI